MRLPRPLFPILLCAALAAPLVAGGFTPAAAAGTGAVHPGVMTYTEGAQCTANFIFRDAADTYIGQAAHCSSTGGNTATNGCDTESLPLGTAVEVGGASKPGTLVYNSWLTMQRVGEADPNTCQYNDLALVRLDPTDAANVDPTIPFWGGPGCLDTAGTTAGEKVYSYGNSSLRGGATQLSPKQGYSLGTDSDGWNHTVYTATPGIPGDSGSAFLDSRGCALGVLSTVQIAPLAAANGVGDLSRELSYMKTHESSLSGVNLVKGTTPFSGGTSVAGVLKLGI